MDRTDLAGRTVAALVAAGRTVGTAESLTGGLVAAALTDVPGSSAVLHGGVVAYTTGLKAEVLGVDATVLREHGAVSSQAAEQMARGARSVLDADFGVATTGVAGPDPSEGKPVGTVFVAVAGPGEQDGAVEALSLCGSREQIRAQTVTAVLELLLEQLPVTRSGGAADASSTGSQRRCR